MIYKDIITNVVVVGFEVELVVVAGSNVGPPNTSLSFFKIGYLFCSEMFIINSCIAKVVSIIEYLVAPILTSPQKFPVKSSRSKLQSMNPAN